MKTSAKRPTANIHFLRQILLLVLLTMTRPHSHGQNNKEFHVVANSSFETATFEPGLSYGYTTPGWSESIAGGTSSFSEFISGFSHHGTNHVGISSGGAIWQDLNTTYVAGRVYSLIVAVGNRSGWTQQGNISVFRLQLVNGTVVSDLTSRAVDASFISPGKFRTFNAVYTTPFDAPAGSKLRIRLDILSGDRAHFDDVQLISSIPYYDYPAINDHQQAPLNPVPPQIPLLNSAVTAQNVLYLDFDGEDNIPPMAEWNGGRPIPSLAHSGMAVREIERAFHVVAEDYRPFRLNVTTDEARYRNARPGQRMRVIITPTDRWAKEDRGADYAGGGMGPWKPWLPWTAPGTTGALSVHLPWAGFQYAGEWFHPENPDFVWVTGWLNGNCIYDGLDCGQWISHESGHTFGLDHDDTTNGDGYFRGHGPEIMLTRLVGGGATGGYKLWAPIMGARGYLSQWSRAEYVHAKNALFPTFQDDVAILGNKLGFVTDNDDTPETAGAVQLNGNFGNFAASGIIGRNAAGGEDVDYYRLTLNGPASLNISLKPAEPFSESDPLMQQDWNAGIAHLFMDAALYRSDGTLCCNATMGADTPTKPESGGTPQQKLNPTEFLRRYIRVTLGAGTYYLKVSPKPFGTKETDGFSNYGNMGLYSFSGTVTWIAPLVTSPSQAAGTVNQFFSYAATSDQSPVTWSAVGLPAWLNLNTTTGVLSGTPPAAGSWLISLWAANAAAESARFELSLTISPPGSPPVITSTSSLQAEQGQFFSHQIVATGNPTNYGVNGGAIPGLSVNSLGVLSGVPTVSGPNYGMTITATNPFGTGNQFITMNIRPPLAEALDNAPLAITYGGNTPWFHQTAVAWTGGDAAQSGAIGHGQSSSFQTTVTGPYGLTFYWRTDCETDWDGLAFDMDGVRQDRISGNSGWRSASFLVPAGSHVLKWTYAKDSSTAVGTDAGWVDEIVLGSAASRVTSSNTVYGTVGQTVNHEITGSYSPTSYGLTGILPPGLVYLPGLHTVAGTPLRQGSWPLTASATNAYGTGTMNVTFVIASSFQSWTSSNSLSGPDAQPTADTDRDGWNNLLEMAFGQNPRIRNSTFAPVGVDPATKRLRAVFTRNQQYADLIYQVQTASTTAGPWTTIAESRDGQPTANLGAAAVSESGSGTVTVTVTDAAAPPASSKRFMRLRIVQQ